LEKTKFLGKQYCRILLWSDTYLPADYLTDNEDVFVLALPVTFRFLYSSLTEAGELSSVSRPSQIGQGKKLGRRHQSEKAYQLLRRGGVLIVPEAEADTIVDHIQAIQPFFQIGYNHCARV
jgi:hypothetical protein